MLKIKYLIKHVVTYDVPNKTTCNTQQFIDLTFINEGFG